MGHCTESYRDVRFLARVSLRQRFKIKLQLCSCYKRKILMVVLLGNQLGVKQRKG